MSSKRLYLKFVEKNVVGKIDMYWENAPVTCKTIWDVLATPITIQAMHGAYSGPEIMMGLPDDRHTFDPRAIPNENQTVFPSPGELLWYYQAPNFFKGMPEEFWEIGLFYGEGGRTFGPTGWIACNYFGRVTEGLAEIAECCRSIRREGLKTVEVGRLA
jgi:hypothetical protein